MITIKTIVYICKVETVNNLKDFDTADKLARDQLIIKWYSLYFKKNNLFFERLFQKERPPYFLATELSRGVFKTTGLKDILVKFDTTLI